jgi:outer membrane protein, multidrug efflux system
MPNTFARLAVLGLLFGCAPAYREPAVNIAPTYGAASPTAQRDAGVPGSVQPAGATQSTTDRPTAVHFSQALSTTPFWRELGDSTLTQLVETAVRANNDVRAAEARLTSTRSSRRLAALDLAPTVTAIGSATRQRQSIAMIPGLSSPLPEQQLWDFGFDAAWEVDIFGRVGRTVRAQSALVASAEHGVEDVQVSIAAEVARTYFELRGAQQQLQVATRNAENQQRTVKLTEDRLSAGRGTAFDTERAKSALYLTLAAVPGIEAQIERSRQRIAVLLGRPPEELPAALFAAGQLPRLPDTLRVGSPEQLVRRRPDVLRAERRVAAQSLLVGAARSEYLPRLSIGARAGYAATSFDSLTRTGTSRVVFGPVLSWPLLDLGRVRERVGMALAQQDEAEAEHTSTVLRALEESEGSLTTYDRAHARLAILGDAVRSSTRAAELARQRFDAGLTDLLQVLDAQRTLLDAENQLALGHTAAATALIAVYKAVGGTWPIR